MIESGGERAQIHLGQESNMASALEGRQLIHYMLAELPVEYREVILLRELEQLSYDEIAAMLEITVEAVRGRLKRARVALHEIRERISDTSAAGPTLSELKMPN